MKNSSIKNSIQLNSEEEKLLKKYLEEYDELFEKIIILSPNDFIQTLKKRVEITLKEKINGFSNDSKLKIEEFIIEKIYCHDYKYSLFAKNHIFKRNKYQIISHYFNNKIIPHCENDKKDDYYIHICGEKFQTYRYKPFNYSINKNINSINNNEQEYLLYCSKCDMIYKNDLIKFKCNFSNEYFYSKVIYENNLNNSNNLATWKKYHCNIIINDSMKCQKCNHNLYYTDKNNLLCKKCHKEFNPKEIKWKCIKCKSIFIAEVKIFNPLEYKYMKICVKETIFIKKKAKPNYLGCNCKIDIKKKDFFHKNSCKGKLYIGELNCKKVVVCEKCESLGLYNDYVWTFPNCCKRFKINQSQEKKNEKKEKEKNENKENENINNKSNQKQINRFFNYSNSNWNIKPKNIYKSPRYKNKLLLPQKNNSSQKEKEKEIKSDAKPKRLFIRNNSAARLNIEKKYLYGLPSPSKLLKEIKKEYNIKLDNINIDNINNLNIKNLTPNITHSKLESNLENTKYSPKINNNRERNKIITNIDLTDVKKINNIYKKYLNTSPKKIFENKKDNSRNNMKTDVDLGDNVKNNIKYKKNIINSYSKVINQFSPNNKQKGFFRKRSNSGYSSIKMNIDDPIPYNRNISKNNVAINKDKIPIKKNIINNKDKSFNNKKEESTSCDSKEKIYKENKNKSPNKKNEKHKKIIPGKFNINDYIIKKQIGQGSFGQIFLVEDKQHNQYALKKIIAGSSSDIESIKKEYQILLDIQNSDQEINVVNILGLKNYKLDITTNALYVLMELAETDWEKEILSRKKRRKYYLEKELMEILSILVKSLSLLQKQNISHRDIKPQNILVFNDENNSRKKIYKLADFGEAKELLKDEKPTNKQTLRGTELYMSPILFYALRGRKVIKLIKHNTYKSDVFSFGLCSLFAATLCFESIYDVRELKSNVSLKIVVHKYLKNRYSQDVINIITKMLDVNETTRMDFIELEKEFNILGY